MFVNKVGECRASKVQTSKALNYVYFDDLKKKKTFINNIETFETIESFSTFVYYFLIGQVLGSNYYWRRTFNDFNRSRRSNDYHNNIILSDLILYCVLIFNNMPLFIAIHT